MTKSPVTGILLAFYLTTLPACTSSAQTETIQASFCVVDQDDSSPIQDALVAAQEGTNTMTSGTTGSDGCTTLEIEVTGTSSASRPNEFQSSAIALGKPFPNPVDSRVVIPLSNGKVQGIRFELFNAIGRRILGSSFSAVLRGTYQISVDSGVLGAGVYFYTLSGNDGAVSGSFTKAMSGRGSIVHASLQPASVDIGLKRSGTAVNVTVTRTGYDSFEDVREVEDGETITIEINRKPVAADFAYTADSLTVAFTNLSENAEMFYWDFGDGQSSTEGSPVHNYASAGSYDVLLVASRSDASDSLQKTITVTDSTTTGNNDIWFAGHSYTRNMEDIADLGTDIAGYHGGEGFLSDWYDDRTNSIDPGFGRGHFVFVEWLQLQSQVEGSAEAATNIKSYLGQNGVAKAHVMVQWFQTEPACTRHGLACGPEGQELFNDLYEQLADMSGVVLIPVGDVFVHATQLQPGLELHTDGSHVNSVGEYLRNVTIYSFLTGIDARTLPDLGQPNATLLKLAAYNVLSE